MEADDTIFPLPEPQGAEDVGVAANEEQHQFQAPAAVVEPAAEIINVPAVPQKKRDAEQDVAVINQQDAKRKKKSTSAPKKERREFTASEKLRIINLLDGNPRSSSDEAATSTDGSHVPQQPTLTNKQIREKFGVSKSSLHRWRQQKERIQIMVQSDGLGSRKRDTRDPLEKIKTGLQRFYNENMEKSVDERLIITTPVVQAMACKIRDELLAEYDAAVAEAAAAAAIDANDGQQDQQPKLNLNEEEVNALRGFKVTKSWSGRVASSMGWLSQTRKKSSNPLQDGEQVDASIAILGSTNTPEDAASEKAKLNTLAFLSKSHPDYSAGNPKVKKARKEFTAVEKLAIVSEMDPEQTANPLVMAEICEKYSTSKSSVFRWKQQYRAGILNQMINEEGRGGFKRDVNDKLGKVKLRLKEFIENNRAQPPETRAPLSSGVLQGKAQEFRDELLVQHNSDPSKSDLKDDEVFALQKFKASKGWARKAAARYGWKEIEDTSYSVAATLRTEAAAAIAAASVAAAEVSVDALMGHGVPTLPQPHTATEEEVVLLQHSDNHQQNQHEDAVNEAMHSVMHGQEVIGGGLGDNGQYV